MYGLTGTCLTAVVGGFFKIRSGGPSVEGGGAGKPAATIAPFRPADCRRHALPSPSQNLPTVRPGKANSQQLRQFLASIQGQQAGCGIPHACLRPAGTLRVCEQLSSASQRTTPARIRHHDRQQRRAFPAPLPTDLFIDFAAFALSPSCHEPSGIILPGGNHGGKKKGQAGISLPIYFIRHCAGLFYNKLAGN